MSLLNRLPRGLRLLLSASVIVSALHAKSSSWSDGQGGTFVGEPGVAAGPFAVFKVKGGGAKRVFFSQLSLDECRRFHEEAAKGASLSQSWTKAKGSLTYDLINRAAVVRDGKLVPADFSTRPEPRFVVLYYGSGWGGNSWMTVFKATEVYQRLKRLYGDVFEVVFMGIKHDKDAQANLSTATRMPWLVANYVDQASIQDFHRFAPEEGERMVLLTNTGLPLAVSDIQTTQQLARFLDTVSATLDACDPDNQKFWTERARLLAVSRPLEHAKGGVAPAVVNNPFSPGPLRKAGITRIVAELSVSAEGKVLDVKLPADTAIAEKLRPNLIQALASRCVVLPALQDGQPVAGTCVFDYTVPAADERLDLERRWVQASTAPQIVIKDWLLLRPIAVPDAVMSSTLGTDESGVTRLSAYKVGTGVSRASQLNSFNSDFFAEAGPGSVAPSAGDTQLIDEEPYTWEHVSSDDGLVDFQNPKRMDYSVGYAYGEFESDKAGAALLGLGSDDGVKIWLNGELVKDSWVGRDTRIDHDLLPLRLLAGKNRILIKIQNVKGAWSFYLRIRK